MTEVGLPGPLDHAPEPVWVGPGLRSGIAPHQTTLNAAKGRTLRLKIVEKRSALVSLDNDQLQASPPPYTACILLVIYILIDLHS